MLAGHGLQERADRRQQPGRPGIAPNQRVPDGDAHVGADEPLEIGPLDRPAGVQVRDGEVDLVGDAPEHDRRHADHLGALGRRRLAGRGDRGDPAVRVWMGPLVDVLVDDLDPVAGPQEGADRPRLVAEDASLELQVAKERPMEDLAVDRRVIHQAGVGRDRLPAGQPDVGVVVALRDPAPLAVVLDPLADHGPDGRDPVSDP